MTPESARGWGCSRPFAKHLTGASEITILEPYVRKSGSPEVQMSFQGLNLMELLQRMSPGRSTKPRIRELTLWEGAVAIFCLTGGLASAGLVQCPRSSAMPSRYSGTGGSGCPPGGGKPVATRSCNPPFYVHKNTFLLPCARRIFPVGLVCFGSGGWDLPLCDLAGLAR